MATVQMLEDDESIEEPPSQEETEGLMAGMRLDDETCLVLVFTLEEEVGGSVDPEEIVQTPYEKAGELFHGASHMPELNCLKDGPVTNGQYQMVVRAQIKKLLMQMGFTLSTFESVDGDEVFLKVVADPYLVKAMASDTKYELPFNDSAYSSMERLGNYPGGIPMYNSEAEPCPAYHFYIEKYKDKFQPVREVDIIRLIRTRMIAALDLLQMQKQNIIITFFPAANHKSEKHLYNTWCNPWKICRMPRFREDDDIRDYFGEQIAFFFKWFAQYTRWSLAPGIVGLLCAARQVEGLMNIDINIDSDTQGYILQGFSIFLTLWTAVFSCASKDHLLRAQQKWGMKGYDTKAMPLPSYKPELEGTWRLWLQVKASTIIVAVFCILNVVAFYLLLCAKRDEDFPCGDLVFRIGVVAVIKGGSNIWSKVAPMIVSLRNPRTRSRYDNSLTWILSSVKIFCAMAPFLQIAFINKYADITCGSDLDAVAHRLYEHGYPDNAPLTDLDWLEPFSFKRDTRTCVYGCFPQVCKLDFAGHLECHTNCEEELRTGLGSIFITHVGCTIAFMLIPFILTYYSVQADLRAEATKGANLGRTLSESITEAKHHYTMLQLQSKKAMQAGYEYTSWGGSYVEDFLELAIKHAYVSAFAVVLPSMCFVAFLTNILEYRLLAMRMTLVTCRPVPSGSEGIGSWQSIFDGIGLASCIVRAGLAGFVMHPMCNWDPLTRWYGTVALEHIMLAVTLFAYLSSGGLADVQRIEDFNTYVVRKVIKHEAEEQPHVIEAAATANIDLKRGGNGPQLPRDMTGTTSTSESS